MNKFRKKRKLNLRLIKEKREGTGRKIDELTEEQRAELSKRLTETMREQRKRIMNLHAPRPGRRF